MLTTIINVVFMRIFGTSLQITLFTNAFIEKKWEQISSYTLYKWSYCRKISTAKYISVTTGTHSSKQWNDHWTVITGCDFQLSRLHCMLSINRKHDVITFQAQLIFIGHFRETESIICDMRMLTTH